VRDDHAIDRAGERAPVRTQLLPIWEATVVMVAHVHAAVEHDAPPAKRDHHAAATYVLASAEHVHSIFPQREHLRDQEQTGFGLQRLKRRSQTGKNTRPWLRQPTKDTSLVPPLLPVRSQSSPCLTNDHFNALKFFEIAITGCGHGLTQCASNIHRAVCLHGRPMEHLSEST